MNFSTSPADLLQPASDAEVARLTRELAQVRAEFQDFVHSVSHDLRAPLRHISAYTLIIEEDLPNPPPDIVGHLTTIRQAAQLLANQLDGLTQLSRLGQHTLSLGAVDVVALAQSVADELTLQHPGQALQWQLASHVPKVLADEALLRQVLLHVMGNAVKFSRSRSPAQVSLTWHTLPGEASEEANGDISGAANHNANSEANVNASREPGAHTAAAPRRCQISILDNGVGFLPAQADKLFHVFAKLHRARDFDGLGLGLVASRRIMARLGGGIGITAQMDAGCRVVLTLPLA